ncbi:FHA domain-containing protein [Nocardia sp. NPDC088792]|uniref:FHA domain-containing protein n=1 Tax=Nocardia sp. NPDC088792 TaxID=3364332 RepID=UPI00382BAFB8
MGRIPTTVALTRGDGLVARFGAVCIVVAGESPSTERILGAAETAATAADPGVAIAQRLAATVFSGGSGQPPAFGVVAPTAGGILVLLHGPVLAVVEGPEGTRRLSGERAMTWADEIIRDPVRRISVSTEGPTATPIPHTDLRAGVVAAGGFVLHAPPTGLTARPRRPADTNPELHPPQPPATDLTRRAPLPTPSHTRFGSEPVRLPIQSPSAPPRSAAGDPPPVYDRRAATFPVGGPEKPEAPAATPLTESASGPPQLTAQVDDPPATAAIEPLDAAKSKQEKPAEPARPSQRADEQQARKPNRAGRPDPEDQPPTAAFDAEAAAAEDAAEQSSTPTPQSTPGPHSPPGPQPTPTPPQPAPGPQPTPSSQSAPRPQPTPAPHPLPASSATPAARSAGAAPMETVAYQAGALVGPDGARYPLDRPYVIGRDPMIDDSVRRAQASPIVIPRDRHVSRVHAHLTVSGGTVFVRDAGTPGGTFMAAPGASEWMRVGQRPVELQRGWSLRIGERIFTYRTDQPHT